MNTINPIDDFLRKIGAPYNEKLRESLQWMTGYMVLRDYELTLHEQDNLLSLPGYMEILCSKGKKPALHIDSCSSFKKLSHVSTASDGIVVEHCESFEELGPCISTSKELVLAHLPKLIKIHNDTRVLSSNMGSNIRIEDAPMLTDIPQLQKVRAGFSIKNCPALKVIPDGFCGGKIEGKLSLNDCVSLESLPITLWVKGPCTIRNCPTLKSLPTEFKIGGSFSLENVPNIPGLPDGLYVKGSLSIVGCSFENLPSAIFVGEDVYVSKNAPSRMLEALTRWKKKGMVHGHIKLV